MTSISKYLTLICVVGALAAGPALAQTAAPAPAAPAAAPAAKAATPKKERSAISVKCSQDADAKGLHGKARHKFRSDCMKAG